MVIENPDAYDGFEWDQAKSDATYAERSLDFAAASVVFESDHIEGMRHNPAYGEQRYVTIGEIKGFIIAVVWTPRGRNRRIISARAASRNERRAYHDAIRNRDAGY